MFFRPQAEQSNHLRYTIWWACSPFGFSKAEVGNIPDERRTLQ
jgi:hypothetical protein